MSVSPIHDNCGRLLAECLFTIWIELIVHEHDGKIGFMISV